MAQIDNVTRQLYHEPLRVTLARNGAIALVGGALLARWLGGLFHWPEATVLRLWPTFGGHWIELWFLNGLRLRLPNAGVAQVGVRIAVWFIGGIALSYGMRLTAMALAVSRPAHWPAWWRGGLDFIAIELTVHLILQLRGRPSFYNSRG